MQPSISAAGPPTASHSDATSKLQVMNVKAAAQRIGLDTTTTGWAILERLSSETDHGPEWNEIWYALSFSKVSEGGVQLRPSTNMFARLPFCCL